MEMDNEAKDAALILENELQRRVEIVLRSSLPGLIAREVEKHIRDQKVNMMQEIAISIGKLLRSVEGEGRRPLWESKPEDFKGVQDD